MTEQQEPLGLGQGLGPFVVDGSTESEGTQHDLDEEEEEREEEEENADAEEVVEQQGCLRMKDEAGESGLEDEQEVEELGVTYRQVRPAFKSVISESCAGLSFLL